jgi:uncharacterized protein (DUF2336 family)
MLPEAKKWAERWGSQGRGSPGPEKSRQSLIEELESTIAGSEVRQRADVLRRITDLFVAGAPGFSPEQVALFDDITCRLLNEVETSVRAIFGQRVATLDAVPPRLVRTLANDDAIEVAGPVLSGYGRLEDADMVETAKTKSQDHLLAISRRATLAEVVTDVLVERGDRRVALSTASNPGARFSEFGCSTLVKRSQDDGDLALQLWSRPDIPRQHLLKLLAECSETVRRTLNAGGQRRANMLRDMVAQATDQIQAKSREASARNAMARRRVEALRKAGKLDEAQLRDFARGGDFDETTIALGLMCDLPIGVIERAMVNEGTEQIVVIAKAAGFSWKTTKALIAVRTGGKGGSAHEIEQSLASFNKLRPETAEKAMQFYRLRERASKQAQADSPAQNQTHAS